MRKKSINNMSYDELDKKKKELVFSGFLGAVMVFALFLGIIIMVMLDNSALLYDDSLEYYIIWNLSAYVLLGIGGVGIIQILTCIIDYNKCLFNMKKIIDDEK